MSKPRVLITGASGALGQAAVKRFAHEGWEVVGTYFHGTAPAESPGTRWVAADVSDPQKLATALGDSLSEPGFDALVHCAGGFRYGALHTLEWADIEFLWSSNLRSALVTARAVLPGMLARKRGQMIFVGARGALQAAPQMSAYAAMKAGLHALVASLDEELRGQGIRVNAVLPSIIDTPANRQAMPQADPSTWVTADALAGLMWRLSTPEMAHVRGALIPVSSSL